MGPRLLAHSCPQGFPQTGHLEAGGPTPQESRFPESRACCLLYSLSSEFCPQLSLLCPSAHLSIHGVSMFSVHSPFIPGLSRDPQSHGGSGPVATSPPKFCTLYHHHHLALTHTYFIFSNFLLFPPLEKKIQRAFLLLIPFVSFCCNSLRTQANVCTTAHSMPPSFSAILTTNFCSRK